jgi:hypothetical protein
MQMIADRSICWQQLLERMLTEEKGCRYSMKRPRKRVCVAGTIISEPISSRTRCVLCSYLLNFVMQLCVCKATSGISLHALDANVQHGRPFAGQVPLFLSLFIRL